MFGMLERRWGLFGFRFGLSLRLRLNNGLDLMLGLCLRRCEEIISSCYLLKKRNSCLDVYLGLAHWEL